MLSRPRPDRHGRPPQGPARKARRADRVAGGGKGGGVTCWGRARHNLPSRKREGNHGPRHLSNRQLDDHKFRRQHKFAPYIADCFCPAKGLVVELNGNTHRADRDEARDIFILRSGVTTLRFTNAEVRDNIEGVLQTIL
ncbi:MAG: endonuclease domain-containing protein [Sphingomonas sp.]|uniref:endonuclease domain-containing protein n=1 Tax=Sphingomonas sp. TaxID=28214 RepID=UPI002A7393A3|nr:endonuclease domain-containing protein [Sphingomonas sp.]